MGGLPLSSVGLVALLIGVMVSTNTLNAECKKQLPSYPIFPRKVLDSISCDVCSYAMTTLAKHVQIVREEKESKSLKLNEEDILEVMAELCSPFTKHGEWVRRVVLKIPCYPMVPTNESSSIGRKKCTDILDIFTSCKRTCLSVSEACETLMNTESMDRIPIVILSNAKKHANITHPRVLTDVVREICMPSEFCSKHSEYIEKLERDLNTTTKRGSLLEQISREKVKEAEEGEMETERMLYSTRDDPRKQPIMFDQEELNKLMKAYKLRYENDPEAKDLTEENIDELYNIADDNFGEL